MTSVNPQQTDRRIRAALLVLAAVTCLLTAGELWLAEHFGSPTQLIPFVLAGLGFATVVAVLVRPSPLTLYALRWTMALAVLGSLYGIYEHLEGNFAFELDIRPNAGATEVVWAALKGANPLLAPGTLAFAGILACLASYRHPALHRAENVAGMPRVSREA